MTGDSRPPKPKGRGPWTWHDADWGHECESCHCVPIMTDTGMCAACTFGEAQAQTELVVDGGYWRGPKLPNKRPKRARKARGAKQ